MIELFAAFCYLTISFNGEAILKSEEHREIEKSPLWGLADRFLSLRNSPVFTPTSRGSLILSS